MKEYKLKAWPDLPAAFRRTSYRRLLTELSQRHVNDDELRGRGLSRRQLQGLLHYLNQVQALETRTAAPPQRLFGWWQWLTQRPLWRRLART
jgi:hypothetical protein